MRAYSQLSDWSDELLDKIKRNIEAVSDFESRCIHPIVSEMIEYEKLNDKEIRAYKIMVSITKKLYLTTDRMIEEGNKDMIKLNRINKVMERKFNDWYKEV